MSTIEQEIHDIKGEQSKMAQDISLIKQGMAYASKEKEDLAKVVDDLRISINRLNLTLGNRDGVEQGKYTVLKVVGSIIGLFASAWIFWATNSIVSNNSYIDYLKKEAESKRYILK